MIELEKLKADIERSRSALSGVLPYTQEVATDTVLALIAAAETFAWTMEQDGHGTHSPDICDVCAALAPFSVGDGEGG